MGSVTNSLSGLSYLTQPGGVLSNLPPAINEELSSAPTQDVVSLSNAAVQTQEVDGLFGVASSATETSAPELPVLSPQTYALPGVSSADLANATPQQQAEINIQALYLQQVEGLFGETAQPAGTTNVMG
ncbi:MAG: hypothetical protein JO336_11485 [Acidobacteriia bacterium]|nr:hypothetical protein [Terriglobia bacterium]MBV8905156.1 hypothetical protein [Terriglobia bacterium]MBV9744603.1 hypothetical protein [Terriglobia bacterium]